MRVIVIILCWHQWYLQRLRDLYTQGLGKKKWERDGVGYMGKD